MAPPAPKIPKSPFTNEYPWMLFVSGEYSSARKSVVATLSWFPGRIKTCLNRF
jgi:hypothetical protein